MNVCMLLMTFLSGLFLDLMCRGRERKIRLTDFLVHGGVAGSSARLVRERTVLENPSTDERTRRAPPSLFLSHNITSSCTRSFSPSSAQLIPASLFLLKNVATFLTPSPNVAHTLTSSPIHLGSLERIEDWA